MLLASLALAPLGTVIALNLAASVFYLGDFVFRGVLLSIGGTRSADADQTIAIEARALRERGAAGLHRAGSDVPRSGDAAATGGGAARGSTIPLSKLDVKIVLEDDDHETIAAARTLGLEGVFEIIRVPPSHAADQAEGLQLRAALRPRRVRHDLRRRGPARARPAARRRCSPSGARRPKLACVQGRLNYFNRSENWLTRMFTLEYSLVVRLPAARPRPAEACRSRSAAPPITSRLDVLREVARLGPVTTSPRMPISASAWRRRATRVGVINSTTYEEANGVLPNWIQPALALDQGLHADLAGAHLPAELLCDCTASAPMTAAARQPTSMA